MSTPNQKADVRPISFVLHNMATGAAPVEVPLVIRPEDLTRSDVSRMAVTQTLGGAFVDDFGKGVPTVQISGHTGWGAGTRPDGRQEFMNLHDQIFAQWHQQREEAVRNNLDPDKVKLIFNDCLDSFTWVVAPQNFVLRRSRSRPLLSQYQINLTWVSYDVAETLSALAQLKATAASAASIKESALQSLAASIKKVMKSIADKVTAVLGPIHSAIASFTQLTANVLQSVSDIASGILSVPAAIAVQALQMGQLLTQAASNVYQSAAALTSIPLITKAYFQQVAASFENAFCVLSNVLKPALDLPNYDDLYGSSNCSSTSGGTPISVYDELNPFNVYQPPQQGNGYVVNDTSRPVPADVAASLGVLSSIDPVLNPVPLSTQADLLNSITSGLGFAA